MGHSLVALAAIALTGCYDSAHRVEPHAGRDVAAAWPDASPDVTRDAAPPPAPADDRGWICWSLDGASRRRCRNDSPERPVGAWSCRRANGLDVCNGPEWPADPGDWSCEPIVNSVVCRRAGQLPEGEGIWDCDWDFGALVCETLPATPHRCPCVPGARRLCKEPVYSYWGAQTCGGEGDETFWGECEEIDIPPGCEPGGRDARGVDWQYAGSYWDGLVFDPDGDGWVHFEPEIWFNPAAQDCATRQGACMEDEWDLDLDGDWRDSAGACDGIEVCP